MPDYGAATTAAGPGGPKGLTWQVPQLTAVPWFRVLVTFFLVPVCGICSVRFWATSERMVPLPSGPWQVPHLLFKVALVGFCPRYVEWLSTHHCE